MAYYTALIAAWGSTTLPAGVTGTPLVSGASAVSNLALLNAWTVAGPNVDVPVSSVVAYLGNVLKLPGLNGYATAAAAVAPASRTEAQLAGMELVELFGMPDAPAFKTSVASEYTLLEGMLTAIAGDSASGLTTADVTALMALAATTIPWWQSVGMTSPVSPNDLSAAGLA